MPVVVIAIAISVIGLVVGSAFGILIDDNDASTPSVPQLATDSEKRLQKKIDEIYDKISPEPDIVLMDFYSETPDGRIKLDKRLNNWPDILAIWAVRTTMADNLDVVALDERRQKMFRQVFEDMTSVEYVVIKDKQTETFVDENGEVREITVTVTTLLYTVISRTYPEMYREYRMTDNMISMTEELGEDFDFRMLVSYAATDFNPLPYPRTGGGRAGVVVDYTVQNLPPSALADEVVLAASQYLGTPYSQIDCSKLTQTVYAELGISLPRTAAEQARYIIENNRAIDPSDLQPGDLIFYALKGDNGRYMYVSHVAIYAGEGMIIDASSIYGYTIYRDMDTFSDSVTVLYGRP
jgi:cell wall-associated NlpC family hydrolase